MRLAKHGIYALLRQCRSDEIPPFYLCRSGGGYVLDWQTDNGRVRGACERYERPGVSGAGGVLASNTVNS